MYTFDIILFNQIYAEQIKTKTFSQVFKYLYIPFLHFIGLQWQTDAVTPAHEHFISNLIYQKIQLNIEQLDWNDPIVTDVTYILYLPEEEMHEIGLLYLNYELLLKRKRTIYLGRCIPIADLKMLRDQTGVVIWVSQFIVYPNTDFLQNYLNKISDELLKAGDSFLAISLKFKNNTEIQIPKGINTLDTVIEAVNNIS
jgi:MerR family transcriptional regulator, light-induced transcriptional regulator